VALIVIGHILISFTDSTSIVQDVLNGGHKNRGEAQEQHMQGVYLTIKGGVPLDTCAFTNFVRNYMSLYGWVSFPLLSRP
jgi:hypothetical protein